MHRGRRVHEWGIAASQMALLANVNRDPKRRRSPFGPAHFAPSDIAREFRVVAGTRLTKATLHSLKPLFQKKKD